MESPQLQADAGLLCIAIANLLDNAVKYSPPVKSPSIFIPMPGKRSYAFATTAWDSPAGQAELIFERYRRGEHTSPVPRHRSRTVCCASDSAGS